jgi:glucan 1,3-beta-glucosidase
MWRSLGVSFCLLPIFVCQAVAQFNDTVPFGNSSSPSRSNGTVPDPPFWLEEIKHQGVATFQADSTYQVFRNVKDFGAKGQHKQPILVLIAYSYVQGDGVSDDTAAINLAISSGQRCGPGTCQSSTTSPAIVYFPAGTYRISAPIIDYYLTQIIGNPNSLPVIKAASNFTAFALIDGNQYQPGSATHPAGILGFKATNVFYRQIRNLVLDTTAVSPNVSVNGIHWPTAQATSLQNVVFRMSAANGTQHQGLFIEEGKSR